MSVLKSRIVMDSFIIVLDQSCFLFTSYLLYSESTGAEPFVFVQHKAIQTAFVQLQ